MSKLFEVESDEENFIKKANFDYSEKVVKLSHTESHILNFNKPKSNTANDVSSLAYDKENSEPRKFDFNAKRVQTNKIDSYFKPEKNESFQNTIAFSSIRR